MGCEVAIDQYIVSMIRDQDIVVKELQRRVKETPYSFDKFVHLSNLGQGLDILHKNLQNERDFLVIKCKTASKSEDEECAMMYTELKKYLIDNRQHIVA